MISLDDPQLIAAFETSHTMAPRVTAYYNGEAKGLVSIAEGDVTFDEGTDVQGRFSVKIPVPKRVGPTMFDPREIDVNGWRLYIEYGVRFTDGFRYAPLGMFVVYDINDNDTNLLDVSGYDTTVLLRDGRFYAPYQIAAGTNYATALSDIASSIGLPSTFPVTGYNTPFLLFTEQDDRLSKMKDMATSLGWSIVSDINGAITARVDAAPVPTNVVMNLIEGEGSRMVTLSRRRTRQGVYNIAVAIGEPAGAATPVVAIAYDTAPNSPTYYLGPFGQVPVFEKSQYITTQAQAQGAADGLLARKKGFGAALSITTWPQPAIRPGDIVQVRRETMSIDQAVPLRAVTVPLRPGNKMTLVTREGQLL